MSAQHADQGADSSTLTDEVGQPTGPAQPARPLSGDAPPVDDERMRDTAPSELTMLFTDIEGSTRLLNRLGASYTEVLTIHRRVLRTAFETFGGRELGTEGDSFFVAFESASDAVAAAVEGQLGLQESSWPAGVALRVRMGLHTGHAEPFEDGLVGLDVHLAARVSATGYGGQVVLSEATARQVTDRLPPGISLLDLGLHRLKDIPEPLHLCQLVVPGLPSTFPLLRTLGAPGSLPSAPTPLVGRDADVAALQALLADGPQRLVTLTGPGGTGKTRLSLAAAEELAPAFADGVHFADLTTATEPSVAWTSLADALGRSGDGRVEVLEHLRERNVLLVLDNLEQLPDAGAPLVGELLASTRGPRLLATSRRPLRLAGEQEYPVPPLSLPLLNGGVLTPEAAGRADAVRLFVQQARLSDPGFDLRADNVVEVVALCHRLDGLPLAVELAAARVRLLPPRALLDHLDEALGLPLPGHPQRQQTLTATVDWSYRMVAEPEQQGFRALAAFGASGGTFDALGAVLDTPSSVAVVSGLLDAALVRVDDDPAGPRVRLLHTVHTVARDLAVRAGELDDLQRRHAEHYVGVAERTAERLRGPAARAARGLIEREMDNLRAALDWSLGGSGGGTSGDASADVAADSSTDRDGRGATGIRLCTALGWFWYLTGYDAESRRWLERASRAAAAQQGPQLAQLLHSFALLLLQQGEVVTAKEILGKSLLLWRRAGNRHGEATVLNSLGIAHRALGDPERAAGPAPGEPRHRPGDR